MRCSFLLSLLLLLVMQPASGQGTQNSRETEARKEPLLIADLDRYEKEAQTKGTNEIWLEIYSLYLYAGAIGQGQEVSWLIDAKSPESRKAAGYILALKKRRENGDVTAAFYYGLNELLVCEKLSKSQGAEMAKPICDSALTSLMVAAKAGEPRAMNYLGLAYSEGIGIERSRFVSADWYVKAGEQFDKQGDRASALQALEDALQVVPAYPAALELRSKLVK